ncbi:hypothetical protein FQN54_007501 [Arachnomyces sp. PD_36]|nr:hypothetical protein FQN54_007501 [Arachnomyces sp. PD_36]
MQPVWKVSPPLLKRTVVNITASDPAVDRRLGKGNLGPAFDSGYETDYEVDENDSIFEDYGTRICDNEEIPPEDNDLTSYLSTQSYWCFHDLPDILYVLQPRDRDAKSQEKPNVTSHPIYTHINIRKFDVLPAQISSKVEGWRVIAWLRLDARIKLRDIVDRMHPRTFVGLPGYSPEAWYRKVHARVALRCKQTYKGLNIVRWWDQDTTHLEQVEGLMRTAGIPIERNSTRGVTPGLIDLKRGEAAGRIPMPSNMRPYETMERPPPIRGMRQLVPHYPPYPPVPGEETSGDNNRETSSEGNESSQSDSSATNKAGGNGPVYDPALMEDSGPSLAVKKPSAVNQLLSEFQGS